MKGKAKVRQPIKAPLLKKMNKVQHVIEMLI